MAKKGGRSPKADVEDDGKEPKVASATPPFLAETKLTAVVDSVKWIVKNAGFYLTLFTAATTALHSVQSSLSGIIPVDDFDNIFRPPMVYSAAQLQSTLFHAVHDHTLERYSKHNAAQAELYNKDMGDGEYERYSEYYGEMNFLYSYAAFVGQVEILHRAAETNDHNRQTQGFASTVVEFAWEKLNDVYKWYQKKAFCVMTFCMKSAIDNPESMQFKQNIGAFTRLLKAVRNVTEAIGHSHHDVRYAATELAAGQVTAQESVLPALPHHLRLFNNERHELGRKMLRKLDSGSVRKEEVIGYGDFLARLDESKGNLNYDQHLAKWIEPVRRSVQALSSPEGYRASGQRLVAIQHALLMLLQDTQVVEYFTEVSCQHGSHECIFLPPAEKFTGWNEMKEEDRYCSDTGKYPYGCNH